MSELLLQRRARLGDFVKGAATREELGRVGRVFLECHDQVQRRAALLVLQLRVRARGKQQPHDAPVQVASRNVQRRVPVLVLSRQARFPVKAASRSAAR